MLAVPVQYNGKRLLILILQRENLVRLQHADPIDLKTADYFIPGEGAEAPEIIIAYEEDDARLRELQKDGSLQALVEYIERGRIVYDGEVAKPKKWTEGSR